MRGYGRKRDVSAVQTSDATDNGKAKARAPRFRRARRIYAVESLEYAHGMFGRNADAVVFYCD